MVKPLGENDLLYSLIEEISSLCLMIHTLFYAQCDAYWVFASDGYLVVEIYPNTYMLLAFSHHSASD